MMRKILFVYLLAAFFVCPVLAQKAKPWTEWAKKDAEKILNDSAWGQTQAVGGPEQPSSTVITGTAASAALDRKGTSGESIGPKMTHYRVRFMSAKPIREAFSRMVVLAQANPEPKLPASMQTFIDRDFGNYLVVTLSIDSDDPKMAAGAMAGLGRLTADFLKDKVYLERKDGKRLLLMDYKPPTNDNLGAKFVFDRNLDGQPFVTLEADNLRFYIELNPKVKVNAKFKVSTMLYDGKIEI